MNLMFSERAVPLRAIQNFCFYLSIFNLLLFLDIYIRSEVSLFPVIAIIFFLISCGRSLRQASYTYWAFSFCSAFCLLYFLINSNSYFSSIQQQLGVFLVFVSLMGLNIILYTPVIYPIAYWWEYDSRFRHDVEGSLQVENFACFNTRLTDLRGKAGSFHVFSEIELGTKVEFTFLLNENRIYAKGEIVSIRDNSLGRGRHYGVKFLDSEGLNILRGFWKSTKVYKKTLKRRSFKNEQKVS